MIRKIIDFGAFYIITFQIVNICQHIEKKYRKVTIGGTLIKKYQKASIKKVIKIIEQTIGHICKQINLRIIRVTTKKDTAMISGTNTYTRCLKTMKVAILMKDLPYFML